MISDKSAEDYESSELNETLPVTRGRKRKVQNIENPPTKTSRKINTSNKIDENVNELTFSLPVRAARAKPKTYNENKLKYGNT